MATPPRFEGKLRLPNVRRSFRFNFRAPFVGMFGLPLGKAARIFGLIKIRLFDRSKFSLQITGCEAKPFVLKFYRMPRFPYFSISNRSGSARMCFILFSQKVTATSKISFSLVQRIEDETQFFNLGDMLVHPTIQKLAGMAMPKDLKQLRTDLLECLPEGPIALDAYWEFAAKIKSMKFPANARDDIQTFYLLLNSSIRRNHQSARKNYSTIITNLHWQGKSAEADALEAEVNAVTAPLVLGSHGFRLPMSAIPLETALSELSEAMQKLDDLGAPSCIACGTLLGFVREGTLLPHDDDIDLSVVVPGNSLDEVVENWSRLMRQILETMPSFQKNAFVSLELPCGIEVDLFPMWVLDDKVYAYPHLFGEFPAKEFFPLVPRDWRGALVNTPSILEPILAVNYGPNWKIRDPHWKFDWGLSRQRFARFLSATKKIH
ncbi:MAG: LicD family protein [Cypionkella sp.]|nr:LicD family protein [Cypionkella sp.]